MAGSSCNHPSSTPVPHRMSRPHRRRLAQVLGSTTDSAALRPPSASAPKEMGGARLGPGVFTLKVWAETFVSCHAATEASPQNWPPYNAGEVSQICGQDPCEASATSTNVAFCQATSPCPNYLQGAGGVVGFGCGFRV